MRMLTSISFNAKQFPPGSIFTTYTSEGREHLKVVRIADENTLEVCKATRWEVVKLETKNSLKLFWRALTNRL